MSVFFNILMNSVVPEPLVYGVLYDPSTTSPACRRVELRGGNPVEVEEFSATPAHNFRRCVMSDLSTREVAYYLDPLDSTKKADGSAANLSGGDGDVMVEIPVVHYRHSVTEDGEMLFLVSAEPFEGSAPHPFFYTSPGGATLRTQYVGAFRSVLCNADGTVKDQGDGTSPVAYASGDCFRSIAGYRPAANVTRANFRNGHIVSGGTSVNALSGQFFNMMMVIDGGTLDTQSGISTGYVYLNKALYAAFRNTGRTAVFGNGTGSVSADDTPGTGADLDLLTMNDGGSMWVDGVTNRVVQFSWRGIEDPFGSAWTSEDGFQKYQNATTDDFSESGYWFTSDTTLYSTLDAARSPGSPGSSFPASGFTGADCVWVSHPWPKDQTVVKTFDPLTFYALTLSGTYNTSQYTCDVLYNIANAGAMGICRGGGASGRLFAGAFFVSVLYATGISGIQFGSRIAG